MTRCSCQVGTWLIFQHHIMKLSPYYCALAAIVLPALTLAKTACYFKNVLCVTVAESGNFVNVTIESTASGYV